MLGFAAALLAATSTASSPMLTISPWWEKVTYTISDDGEQHACTYESSIATDNGGVCEESDSTIPVTAAASSSSGAYTKITIERRFVPGDRADPGTLQSGDTLLGGQMMELAIDGSGTVSGCRIVASAGEIRPAYGCDEARTERFEAGAGLASPDIRQGYMTILVYGHEEQLA